MQATQQDQTKKKIESLDQLENITNEEKIHLTLNKDTGEIYDDRKGEFVKIQQIKLKNPNQQDVWKKFWEDIAKLYNQLIDASEQGNYELVEDILKNKQKLYSLDINHKDIDDWTALHKASNEGHLKVVQILLEYKADINCQTQQGLTALHFAAIRGFNDIVNLLVQKGAKISVQDNLLNTPLHYASESGYIIITKRLLECNADTGLKNSQGLTPIGLMHDEKVFQVFKDFGFQDEQFDKQFNRERTDFVEKNTLIQKYNQTLEAQNQTNNKMTENKQFHNTTSNNDNQQDTSQDNEKKYSQIFKQNKIQLAQIQSAENFEFYKKLGKGAFGNVYLVKMNKIRDQKYYAMKVIDKDQIKERNLLRFAKNEKDVMYMMDHPFIVKLKYAFQTDQKLFLVMQYCPGGDLSQLLDKYERLPEELARIYLAEILLAVDSLHRRHIIFRDLKPSNILLDEDGHAILSDFGLAIPKQDIQELTKTFCGTPAYLAPEMIRRSGHNRMIDWYLLGVLFYEMLTGVTPYYADNKEQLYYNILKGPLKMPNKGISDSAKDLMLKLLIRNPMQRLGYVNDGEDIKSHVFFQGLDFEDVYLRKIKPNVKLHIQHLSSKQIEVNTKELFADKNQDILKVDDWTEITLQ